MHYPLGPGDLHLEALAKEEAASKQWLREATELELLAEGICPRCRETGCEACGQTGHVVVCENCGAAMAPGDEQIVPVFVDRPNGPKTTVCTKCATEVPDPA